MDIINEIIIPIINALSTLIVAISVVFSIAYKLKKDKEINKLKKQINLLTENPLTFKNGIYYNIEGYPFCPVCYGKEGYRIPLTKQYFEGNSRLPTSSHLRCHECNFQIDIA